MSPNVYTGKFQIKEAKVQTRNSIIYRSSITKFQELKKQQPQKRYIWRTVQSFNINRLTDQIIMVFLFFKNFSSPLNYNKPSNPRMNLQCQAAPQSNNVVWLLRKENKAAQHWDYLFFLTNCQNGKPCLWLKTQHFETTFLASKSNFENGHRSNLMFLLYLYLNQLTKQNLKRAVGVSVYEAIY